MNMDEHRNIQKKLIYLQVIDLESIKFTPAISAQA